MKNIKHYSEFKRLHRIRIWLIIFFVVTGFSIFSCSNIDDKYPPIAPSGLQAEASSSSQIDLMWVDNSTNELGFSIERKTLSEDYSVIGTSEVNETSYIDSRLAANQTYYYRVRAYNNAGYSFYSNEDSATTLAESERWRVLPIRSEEEYDQGKIGGEAEQHPHSIARSRSNPDIIYLSHDVAQLWKSVDAGETWEKPLGIGLWLNNGQSIEVDPVDPNTVFFIVAHSYNWLAEDYEGLYRSLDAGETWEFVLQTDTNYDSGIHRIHRHNIAYDLASVGIDSANRWYAAFPDNGLFRSDDGGSNWTLASSLAGHSIVYAVEAHPSDGQTLYLASSEGLFVSFDQGADLQVLGDLPNGAVSSIAIHPQNPQTIYTTIKGDGLYRSSNGGANFIEIRDFDASRVFINHGHPDVLYLVGISDNTITTHDGGMTWIEDMVTEPAPGLGRGGSWKSRIAGELSGIVPNPNDPDEAVAYSRATLWKTTDGGHIFADSSTLFTGFAWSWWNKGAAFDPYNPERIAFFNCDVGMVITHNEGDFFEQRNAQAWDWYSSGYISWIGTYAGAIQPVPDSVIIVASVGGYFDTQLMRSTDEGETWELVTTESEQNLFIAFHPDESSLVYAGNKISYDAGETFENVDFGQYNNYSPSILGMCLSDPDTIYAMDSGRYRILRSDDRGLNWYLYVQPGWRFRRLDSLPTFAVDPVDCDKIYTLFSDYDLAIFNGIEWRSTGVLGLSGGEELGNFVRSVAIDPDNSDVIYAGMSASGGPCIFRSLDGGLTWEDITYNQPRTGVNAMAVNPHTSELYRGSAFGTWIFPAPPSM
ncbi:MAG: hypothetical protein SVZ03_09565 [Spirochaetota bacterium]|nr:hypothetical protein [Spirochaetota bacterium]